MPVTDLPDETEGSVREAMAKRVLLAATYNKGRSVLAPHSLFERHGELYLRAVTVERDGRAPREAKLGTFKLAGLSEVERTRRLFSKAALFSPLEAAAGVDA